MLLPKGHILHIIIFLLLLHGPPPALHVDDDHVGDDGRSRPGLLPRPPGRLRPGGLPRGVLRGGLPPRPGAGEEGRRRVPGGRRGGFGG